MAGEKPMDEKKVAAACSMNTCRETGVCLMESNCQSASVADELVEVVARALAGEEWDAKSFNETLSGQEPDEMREYWRDKARDAITAIDAFQTLRAFQERADSMTKKELTPAQIRKLKDLPDEFTPQDHDWKAGKVFLDLLDAGLVDWKDKPLPHTHGDVRSGPGSHGSYRWHIRRTAAGRMAIGLPPLAKKEG